MKAAKEYSHNDIIDHLLKIFPADLADIKNDLETNLGSEFHRKLQWARSLSTGASDTETMDAGKSCNRFFFTS